MSHALKVGLLAVRKNPGLVVLLLALNIGLAAVLAVPLASALEASLAKTPAASGMLYGFDYPWWSEWSDDASGYQKGLAPDIFGAGFAFKNVDLLLKGELPLRLLKPPFAAGSDGAPSGGASGGLDAVVLGLAAIYMLLQIFLSGGLLGAMRAPAAGWTVRGLLHGSGFYAGRMLRLAAVTLAVAWLLFRLYAPVARWMDERAAEAVSESTAMTWTVSRHALLLLAVLVLHTVSGYAKALVVVEERASAVLAFASALGFCVSNARRVFGHYFTLVGAGIATLAIWALLDAQLMVVGYKTQLVALVLFQALVATRLALRLALMAGQIAVLRGARNA